MLEVEQFDFQDVPGLCAVDCHGASERMNRVEADVGDVCDRRTDVDLSVDGVPTLEADDLAGFDGERRGQRVVPRVVNVVVGVARAVIDRVVATKLCRGSCSHPTPTLI